MEKLEQRRNLKSLIVLAIPVILEQILTTLLQYVDTAMVGRLGAAATASVSLTTSVNWLIGSSFSAIGVAVVAIVSAAYGAGDSDKIKRVSSQIIIYVAAVGLVIGALAVGLSPVIPVWMQADVSIQRQASVYFGIISIPLVFRASTVICACALRAVKDTRTPFVINLLANILNVILNYLLIYTAGLGVTGAAIATAVSSALAGMVMFIVMMRSQVLRCEIRPLRFDRDIFRETVRIGLPALATSTASCLGHIVFASLVSSMGTTVFAAHSIALSAETLFYLPGYGLRSATSTLIGISVGEDDHDKFKVIERQSVILTVVMMAVTGLLLFLFAEPMMRIFTPDEEVIRQGSRVLRLIAVSEPLFGLMIVSEGIYYGLGQTKITFIVATTGSWGIRILSTVICVHVLHTTLFEVWICMFADNAFRALAMAIPLFSGLDSKYFSKRRQSL
ncbi:MAG: MATE family efflux transporter [Spirochaetales bacterium]|nr:MATE family efflux transporter [Spirochaetales bacterium]MBQ3831076.1 MATE family efflux transporter [Spirochaetales bacterium]